MAECPASREAIEEQEEKHGEVGCPICGQPAAAHPSGVEVLEWLEGSHADA